MLSALLILPSFVHGQTSTSSEDSTQLVAIPRWVHWRALRDVKLYRQCDSLLSKYDSLDRNNDRILAKYDSLDHKMQKIVALGDSLDSYRLQMIKSDMKLIGAQTKEINKWKERTKISLGSALGAGMGGIAAGAPGAAVGLVIGAGIGWIAAKFF